MTRRLHIRTSAVPLFPRAKQFREVTRHSLKLKEFGFNIAQATSHASGGCRKAPFHTGRYPQRQQHAPQPARARRYGGGGKKYQFRSSRSATRKRRRRG